MRREFGFWAPAKNHLPARPPTVPTSALHSPLWAPAVARYGWQRPTVASCGGPAHARESSLGFRTKLWLENSQAVGVRQIGREPWSEGI